MLVGGGIFKLLWSPEIGSEESIPPAYVAWRAGTKTIFLLGSWPLWYMNSWLIISVDNMRSREYRMITEDQDSHCRIIWHLSHPSPSPVCKLGKLINFFYSAGSCLSQVELTGPQPIIQYSLKRKGAFYVFTNAH